jgi:1A family penicillin-binding protein
MTSFRWFHRLSRPRKIALSAVTLLLAVVLAGGVWLFGDLPPIDRLQAGLALPSSRIYDRHGQLLYEIIADTAHGGRNTAIPLAQIPQQCRDAVIAIEDANFYQHPGVDIEGIVRALWINVRGGEVLAGGSTITQQVARNLLLDPDQRAERSLRRKLREAVLALRLQSAYSKDDVLALYLNQSYFGNLAYGIEAAAGAYFGKGAADLSLAECALLAGLVQAPAAYDPLANLDAATGRQHLVLDRMAALGVITAAQAEAAKADALQFASVPFPIEAPHFVMAVLRQLERDYGEALRTGGLEVTTTLDLDWQNAAEAVMRQQLYALNHPVDPRRAPAEAHNAALVSLDPHTGQILAMVGSPDYFDESIDGAVNAALALRQPGSALKPFTFAAAFDPALPEPFTAATMLLDVETPFVTRRLESYTPANYALVEHGPVSAREALASSLNIPAVQTLDHVGINAMVQLASEAGMRTLAENPSLDLAVTLGGGEVRLLDLVQAYSIFANAGRRAEPVYLLEVRDAQGGVLFRQPPAAPGPQIIDERVAFLITDILSDDHARVMGFGRHSALNIGRPAAAKTGTTTDTRDNWIVGYTPNLVTGVWVGNADNTPMVDVSGISGAGPIWNTYMRAVLLGQPELTFAVPDGLTRVRVCSPSGMLPTPACQQTRDEWFIAGTEPAAPDTIWQTVALDRRTGLLADAHTPDADLVNRVYEVLPQEARDWALRNNLPQPPSGAALRVAASDDRLRLLEPDPYTSFELSPQLPPATQRLRLTVGAPANTARVTYVLDGEVLGTVTEEPWALWWPLALGEHTLVARAELADGSLLESEPIPFTVVRDAPPQSYTVGP